MKKILITSLLALAATTSSFATVKAGKFGMGFAYSGNFGLMNTNKNNGAIKMDMPTVNAIYHVTDMIGVALNVGFYTTSYEDKSGLNAAGNGTKREYSTTAWGLGLEVPIYLAKLNMLHLYVAPGLGYVPVSTKQTDTTIAGTTTTVTETKNTSNYLTIYGALGLQIPINDQLHAFGRTTIGYGSGSYNNGIADSKDSYFGIQSWSVGALFYFN